MGLAVMVELPLVVIDVQRAGPSTGMPTKTEQADLLQAMFGRNGESPVPIVAPATPAECFDYAIEAVRLALKYMTPVMYLSDGFLANGAEPWKIPDLDDLPDIAVDNRDRHGDVPALRRATRETLSRPWAVPGTPGLEHRIGGLEKADITGNVSLRPGQPPPDDRSCASRRSPASPTTSRSWRSTARPDGDLLILGWGSHLRRHPQRGRATPGRGLERRARPPAPHEPVPDEHRAGAAQLTSTCSSPRSTWASCRLLLRAKFLIDVSGPQPGPRQAIPHHRDQEAAEELLGDRSKGMDETRRQTNGNGATTATATRRR